jgi:hypothetical protein
MEQNNASMSRPVSIVELIVELDNFLLTKILLEMEPTQMIIFGGVSRIIISIYLRSLCINCICIYIRCIILILLDVPSVLRIDHGSKAMERINYKRRTVATVNAKKGRKEEFEAN